jgi:hypothetical protein
VLETGESDLLLTASVPWGRHHRILTLRQQIYRSPFRLPGLGSGKMEIHDTSSEGEQADAYRGVVILGSDGCAQYWALVVRGPDFGKIWILADVGIQPTIPGMSFTEWYEAWLDGKQDWWS